MLDEVCMFSSFSFWSFRSNWAKYMSDWMEKQKPVMWLWNHLEMQGWQSEKVGSSSLDLVERNHQKIAALLDSHHLLLRIDTSTYTDSGSVFKVSLSRGLSCILFSIVTFLYTSVHMGVISLCQATMLLD